MFTLGDVRPFLILICGLLLPCWANAGACPYGTAYADGCPTAPPGGVFQRANFGLYAIQDGQPSFLPSHPMPWNVAGWDYAVGYPSMVLQDPATAVLPAGCIYTPTGSPGNGPLVKCSATAGVRVSGFDFSLHHCTVLEISSSVTGTVEISNDNFQNGRKCAVANGYLVKIDSGSTATLNVWNNVFDGNYPAFTASLVGTFEDNRTSGTGTFLYNAFINSPSRPINGSSTGDLDIAFNYFDGWVFTPGEHGEVAGYFVPANSTMQNTTYQFNTVLTPSNAPASSGTTSFYISSGRANGAMYVNSIVNNNTIVTNLNNVSVTIASSVATLGYGTYVNFTATQNYVDPTGSYYCFQSGGSPVANVIFSGNVNLRDGSAVTGFAGTPGATCAGHH